MADRWRRAMATEGEMWRSMWLWVRRRRRPAADTFGYAGAAKPILGVFIGLSLVELPIFDLIVRHVVPWRPARWIVLVLGVWGLLWMIGLLASLIVHPHSIDDEGLHVRRGAGIDVLVPWENIESVGKRYRSVPSGRSVRVEEEGERRVLNLGKQTSVDVRLRRPMTFDLPTGRTEPIDEVRLGADDPDSLVRAARIVPTTA